MSTAQINQTPAFSARIGTARGIAPALFVSCIAAVELLRGDVAAWVEMWSLAFVLFGFFKWLTWVRRPAHARSTTPARTRAYFLGWVGMDVDSFCGAQLKDCIATRAEWKMAAGNTVLGAALLWGAIRFLSRDRFLLIGAAGMAATVLFLHFGIFHLLSLVWRRAGVAVQPIMKAPILATSLADFWGQRWNRAYRRVSYDCFFRPAAGMFGSTIGTLIAFLASGLIHEIVISVPARGGYGGPTAYFLLQGLGLVLERTAGMRKLTQRSSVCGWCYMVVFVVGPAGWLFHTPFLTRVIVPFLNAIGAISAGGSP